MGEFLEAKNSLLTFACVVIRQGNQGVQDAASKAQLESEFGTSKDEEVVKQILEKGTVIETAVRYNIDAPSSCEACANDAMAQNSGRDGNKNDSKGGMVAH